MTHTALAPSPELLVPVAMGAALDGRAGTNRASTPGQVGADDDLAAIGLWLAEFAHSPHTFRSYRKEAVRLVLWATRVRGKAVSSLTREDVLAYEAFLANPTSEAVEAMLGAGPYARPLFAGPLSAASQHQAMGILAGLFTYLVNAGYLAGNPWTLRRRKNTGRSRRIERYLEHAQWNAVLAFVETLPQEGVRDRQHYERVRWVLRFLYHTALRVSEAANARVNDFVRRREKWWLRVIGKGGVEGEVPIAEELIADFARYRTFHGLAPTPSALDTAPVILSITGRIDRCLTPTAVYLIVKGAFGQAVDALAPTDPVTAAVLRKASTHWLRHTAASHQADAGTDLRHIQKNLRHASIDTTAIYLHAEDDARHRATTGKSSGS